MKFEIKKDEGWGSGWTFDCGHLPPMLGPIRRPLVFAGDVVEAFNADLTYHKKDSSSSKDWSYIYESDINSSADTGAYGSE